MKTVIWYIYFWLYLLVKWPVMHKGLKAQKQGDWATGDALAARWVPDWAGKLMKLAGVTITVEGRENIPAGRACVFVANHRSYYDIPVMLTQMDAPHGLVAKKEVEKIPLVRGWMRLLHCVFLDREDPRKAMASLNEAIENVKKGYSMTIFPEGTRNKGEEGTLNEFKGGAFRIATKAKAPVVPVALTGTRDVMENNRFWLMKPAHVTVRILPAIETAGMSRDEVKELPERTAQIIQSNLGH